MALACVAAFRSGGVRAQPAPSVVTPAPTATPVSGSASPFATTVPAGSAPSAAPSDGTTPAAGAAPAVPAAPTPVPTQPPITVDPASAGISPGGTQTLQILSVLGTVTAVVADPALASATVDQEARTVTIVGKALGATTVTLTDGRGLTRVVPVRVAFPAGDVSTNASVRITGSPATQLFVREQAVAAAIAAASTRPGATAAVGPASFAVPATLGVDDVTFVDVPIAIAGDPYFTVLGTTHVRVENFAQPPVAPESLLVSDFPERLHENGMLFTADIDATQARRFLYYHFNPAGEPDRRIVLKVRNTGAQPALVQFIVGAAGPGTNEMQIGHLSTERFLVRRAQQEGSVIAVPAGATVTLSQQALPAKSLVSAIAQIHEIDGPQLHLTLVAQNAADPIDGPVADTALLLGDHPHARGIYSIPEFFFDKSYDTDGPDLEIPIGQIPLPNTVEGQTLAGDYGVLQSVTVRIVNNDPHNARQIALYASPRGGRATGTFVIDRVLVQAHALPAFGHYKLRQYTIPPGSFIRTEIVTMPEGGSSYPVRLILAPDDGSASPGAPDSLVY